MAAAAAAPAVVRIDSTAVFLAFRFLFQFILMGYIGHIIMRVRFGNPPGLGVSSGDANLDNKRIEGCFIN